jgi:hypothetical protein
VSRDYVAEAEARWEESLNALPFETQERILSPVAYAWKNRYDELSAVNVYTLTEEEQNELCALGSWYTLALVRKLVEHGIEPAELTPAQEAQAKRDDRRDAVEWLNSIPTLPTP